MEPPPTFSRIRAIQATRAALAALTLGVVFGVWIGCGDPTPEPEAPKNLSTAKQAVSPVGIERVIPIRVIRQYDASTWVGGPTDQQLSEGLRQNIFVANNAFRPAGIQFYIKSFEDVDGCGGWHA
ncbi:MAG: hypothetical protein ACOC1F_07490, partial [Myxococcota bacterium]